MKGTHFKAQNGKYVFNLTFGMTTLAVIVGILIFAYVGIRTSYDGILNIFQPKVTYLVYHCKKKHKAERVPMIIDGMIKTEADIWALAADIEAAKNCKVIIEPGWRTIAGKKAKGEKD